MGNAQLRSYGGGWRDYVEVDVTVLNQSGHKISIAPSDLALVGSRGRVHAEGNEALVCFPDEQIHFYLVFKTFDFDDIEISSMINDPDNSPNLRRAPSRPGTAVYHGVIRPKVNPRAHRLYLEFAGQRVPVRISR